MKLAFLKSDFPREHQLAEALEAGIVADGDECEVLFPAPKDFSKVDADFIAAVGMKRGELFKWCMANGQRFIYFDKGYYHREFEGRKNIILWRASVDSQQPLEFIENAKQTPERWLKLGREIAPWRKRTEDGHIIIANSSDKYHEFYNLPSPTEWVEKIVEEIRQYTNRPIWYRPKPSFVPRGARPIAGTKYCPRQPLSELFPNCHALVTHGSYIAVDALLNGVPSVILGTAVTRSISSCSLEEIECPRQASDDERLQVLANMAWCQYRLEEWQSGLAWRNIKRLFV